MFLFEVRSDNLISREFIVVVLSDLISVLNPSSFVFTFSSSYIFSVSILVLILFLVIILLRFSSYDIVKEAIFLSW